MATYNFSSVPPPAQYEEEVSLLKSMFEEWDDATLIKVLSANNGNAEAAIDTILAAGSPNQYNAQQQIQQSQTQQRTPPPQQTPYQQHPIVSSNTPSNQDMVMVTAPPGSGPGTTLSITHNGASFHVRVPPGVGPGGQFIANVPRMSAQQGNLSQQHAIQQQQQILQQQQERQAEQLQMQQYQQQLQQQQQQQQQEPPQPKGRGLAVQLPEDFLRPPGWKASGSVPMEGEMSDEQLAILLQDELFLQELAAHPEFSSQFSQEETPASTPRPRSGSGSAGTSFWGTGRRGTSQPSAPTSSWSASMKNRLKSMGANFNRRKRQTEGYGSVGDGETVTEESPFHWADDGVEDSNEMVTFNGQGNSADPSVVRREAEDLDFPPVSPVGSGGDQVESAITGDELIAQSAEDPSLVRQPSGGDAPFIDVDFGDVKPEATTYPKIDKPRSAPTKEVKKEVFDI